jgi:Flp pilus assembly protein TadD
MKMKKLIAVTVMAAMVFALTACSGKEANTSTSENATTTQESAKATEDTTKSTDAARWSIASRNGDRISSNGVLS